jgi:hypothetical protein
MLEGEDAFGTWLVQITDDTLGETGTLDSLCLDIQHDLPDATGAHGGGGGGIDPDATPRTLGLFLSPNPARSQARVIVALPEAGEARVEVFDIAGRRVATVANGWLPAGVHRLRWNGADDRGRVSGGGVYFVRVTAGAATRVERLTLAR